MFWSVLSPIHWWIPILVYNWRANSSDPISWISSSKNSIIVLHFYFHFYIFMLVSVKSQATSLDIFDLSLQNSFLFESIMSLITFLLVLSIKLSFASNHLHDHIYLFFIDSISWSKSLLNMLFLITIILHEIDFSRYNFLSNFCKSILFFSLSFFF